MEKNYYQLNAVLLGESGVGKSTVLDRILGKDFSPIKLATLANICSKYEFSGGKALSNAKVVIYFWDTAGEEKFRANCTHIIKKADIIIFIRDEEKSNFEGDDGWISFANEHIQLDLPEKKVFFVLNKTDLIDENKKSEINEDLRNIAQGCNDNSEVFLISSKNSDGIANFKNKIESVSIGLIKNFLKWHNKEINIVLFGESMVGKTSLVNLLLGNEYIESTIATLKEIISEYYPTDLKSNDEIKFNYYDLPGQEQLIEEFLNRFSKSHIIIFLNDNEHLIINYKILERKLGINGIAKKKLLFCINKADLIPKKNINNVKQKYMESNKKPFFKEPMFISCKTGEGIKDLKNKILDLGNDIAEEMNKGQDEKQTTLDRRKSAITLNEVTIKEKSCWESFKDFLRFK